MPTTRNSRGGSAMNYFFGIPKELSRRLFDPSLPPSSNPEKFDVGSLDLESQKAILDDSQGSVYKEPSTTYSDGSRERKGRPFAIYPGATRHTYVYEPSISSKSDILSLSENPTEHRGLDSASELSFSIDASPALASSSLETLQSTLSPPPTVLETSEDGSPSLTSHHLSALIEAHMTTGAIDVPLPPSSVVSDSDSDSTIAAGSYPGSESGSPHHGSFPMTSSFHDSPSNSPPRRPSPPMFSHLQDDSSPLRRVDMSSTSYFDDRNGRESRQSMPPGLSSSPPNMSYLPTDPRASSGFGERVRRDSFSTSPPSRSPLDHAFASRRSSIDSRSAPPSSRMSPQDQRSPPSRGYTYDERAMAPSKRPHLSAISVSARNVKWSADLVCPSPVPLEERRKGWFNRRGDQLWTNAGSYKPPLPGQEYPRDLHFYPEPGTGWMNEDGTRIDMQHRLIPKVPLRSALKRSPPQRGDTVIPVMGGRAMY